jgi:preprotein translocase subunit SecG
MLVGVFIIISVGCSSVFSRNTVISFFFRVTTVISFLFFKILYLYKLLEQHALMVHSPILERVKWQYRIKSKIY